jgi:hypothetical protein
LRRRSYTAVGVGDAVDFNSPSADAFVAFDSSSADAFVAFDSSSADAFVAFASPSADAFVADGFVALAVDIFVFGFASAVPESDAFVAIIC